MAEKTLEDIKPAEIQQEAFNIAKAEYETLREGITVTGKTGAEREKDLNRKVYKKALKKAIQYSGEGSTRLRVKKRVSDGSRSIRTGAGGTTIVAKEISLYQYLTDSDFVGAEAHVATNHYAGQLEAALSDKEKQAQTGEEDPKNNDETTKFMDSEDKDGPLIERRFQEQCFLIDNFRQLVPMNYRNRYGKYFTCVTDDPSRVIAKITTSANLKPFLDLQPSQIASAHPQLRFFKINNTKKGRTQKEILFVDHTQSKSINNYFANDKSYHDGVGIKSFSWKFVGKSQVTVERNIECKLLLAFRNLEDLDPDIDKSKYGTFLDMLLYDSGKKEINPYGVPIERWQPEKYEIQVMAGWSEPDIGNSLVPSGLRKYLQTESITMRLVLNSHAFSFNEDGSGTVEIGFQGVMDGHMEDANTDIFNIGPTFKKAIERRRKAMEKDLKLAAKEEEHADKMKAAGAHGSASRAKKAAEVARQKAAAEESFIQDISAEQRTAQYQKLLTRLRKGYKIRYIDLNEEAVGLMQQGQLTRKQAALERKMGLKPKKRKTPRRPKFVVMDEMGGRSKAAMEAAVPKHKTKTTAEAGDAQAQDPAEKEQETDKGREDKLKAANKEADAALQAAVPSGHHRISFFYLGDLLEAAFSMIRNLAGEELAHSKGAMRYLLGDITFIDPMNGQVVTINLADVPISLSLFLEWYNNKAVKPMLSSWPIRSFIHDTVHDLVLAALSPSCFSGYPTRPKMYMSYCEGPGRGKGLKIDRVPSSVRVTAKSIIPAPALRVAGQKIPSKLFTYTYIYAHNAPSAGLRNNPAEDARNGIYHFHIGKDAGLLKSISYSKEDAPGIKEARTEMEGIDPTSGQLRDIYRVKIKAIGSTIFRPGQYVYVHPRVSGNKAKRANSLTIKLGMAGYVFLETVENIIKPGVFETVLEGINDGIVGGQFGAKIKPPKRLAAIRPTVEENATVPMTDPDTGQTIHVPRTEVELGADPSTLAEGHQKNVDDAAKREEAKRAKEVEAETEAQRDHQRAQEQEAVYRQGDAEISSQPDQQSTSQPAD